MQPFQIDRSGAVFVKTVYVTITPYPYIAGVGLRDVVHDEL